MKKFLAILLALLMVLTLVACANEEEEGDEAETLAGEENFTNNDGLGYFTYEINQYGHYSITGYETYSSEKHAITLPEEIDDIEVTGIASEAFKSCTSLTAITIPSSITFIEDLAFYGCDNITEFTIPETVTEIGAGAFRECTALKTVTLPSALTELSDQLFWGCTSLTTINVPNTVTRIGDGTFWECDAFTEILLPAAITEIGDAAFYGCDSLAKLHINSPILETIGEGAFGQLGAEEVEFFIIPTDETFTAYFEENFANNPYDYAHYTLVPMQD